MIDSSKLANFRFCRLLSFRAGSRREYSDIHPGLLAQTNDQLPQQFPTFHRKLARINLVHAYIIPQPCIIGPD
jgi:hypothetical protein